MRKNQTGTSLFRPHWLLLLCLGMLLAGCGRKTALTLPSTPQHSQAANAEAPTRS